MRNPRRIESVCDLFYSVMSDHAVYDIMKLLRRIRELSGRDMFNIEDDDIEEWLFDGVEDIGEDYCNDNKDKELYKFWEYIKMAWKTSPDLRLGQFFMAYIYLDEELTLAQVKERISEHFKVEVPLCFIKTYYALPCATEIFEVKGISAYDSDFGTSRSEGDGNYGCAYHEFVPYETPKEGVLEKYGITLEEYKEICSRLEDELYVGGCGWCS